MARRSTAALAVLLLAFGTLTAATAAPAAAYDNAQPTGYLRVLTSPPVPSWIRTSTGYGNSWGMWVTANTGPVQVCFMPVIGYDTPPCQTVTVDAGATTTVTGTFTARASLHVTTSPAVASAITVDGVTRNNWGAWFFTDPGPHTVCWGPVAGYDPPPCQNVNAVAGATATVTGTFTANPSAKGATGVGYLRVTTSPPAPLMIQVDGQLTDAWGLNWMEIAPGDHQMCVLSDGDYVPDTQGTSCSAVTVVVGQTATVALPTHHYGTIRITTSPPAPTTVSIDGADVDDWGGWTNAPAGLHTVCWSALPNATKPPCKDVTVAEGQQVAVTGTFGPATTNVSRFAGTGVKGTSGDGGPALSAELDEPWGAARGPDGAVYFSDPVAGLVRRVANGTITTYAGCTCPYADNVPATQAQLLDPAGLAFDANGDLFIADAGWRIIRRVDHLTGIMTTVAGNRVDPVEPIAENVAPLAAPLSKPTAVAFDANNTMYILDAGLHRVRRVANGLISTYVGSSAGATVSSPIANGHSMTVRGTNLYFTDFDLGYVRRVSLTSNTISNLAGSGFPNDFTADPHDGAVATTVNMMFASAITTDAAGNVFVADTGRLRIRRIDAQTGVITSVFDGTNLIPIANPTLTCDPGCGLWHTMGLAISGQDLIVTFAGEHLVRRIAGVVPAGP